MRDPLELEERERKQEIKAAVESANIKNAAAMARLGVGLDVVVKGLRVDEDELKRALGEQKA